MSMTSFEILSGDVVVAVWEGLKLTVLNDQLLPLYLKKTKDANLWLASRAIDSHRTHSRLLKKALRMSEKDDVSTVIRANGATITDNYWIREPGSQASYSDVCFDAAYFRKPVSKSISKLALSGSSSSFNVVANNIRAAAAELTNTGSFEKCWKNIDGKWWLIKTGNHNERFSELFVYQLCSAAGIPCAVYEKQDNLIKTLDFTDGKFNFEPAFTFMGEEEDYEKTVSMLQKLCPEAVPDYIRMIFIDALVMNPDRHTANFGLLRDRTDGKLIGLAPLFDHNMALIARGYPKGTSKSDLLINLFTDVISKHPPFKNYLPEINEHMVREAVRSVRMRVRTDEIVKYVMGRYELITVLTAKQDEN